MVRKPTKKRIEESIKVLQQLIKYKHEHGSVCITTALCNRLKEAN